MLSTILAMAKISVFALLALVLCAQVYAAPTGSAVSPKKYLVRLRDDSSLDMHIATVRAMIEEASILGGASNELGKVFQVGNVKGYSARFSDDLLQKLSQNSAVMAIEENHVAHTFGSQKGAPSWGLVRVSQRDLNLSAPYNYPDTAGTGVTAYIIDTGVLVSHPDFGGRASWGITACDNCVDTDDNGHGTHVGTTIGGTLYGVAKNAEVVAVKVLNGSGSGTYEGVIAGIEWAADQVSKANNKKNVANMSLGGPKSEILNSVVEAAIAKGLNLVVAAGNENSDACDVSPASAAGVVAVGSTTKTDSRSYFSNFGKCVALFAPGSAITAGWNDGKTKTISGTSMASPHVAGVVALYLGQNGTMTTSQIATKLRTLATTGKVTDPGVDSPNLLVYNGV